MRAPKPSAHIPDEVLNDRLREMGIRETGWARCRRVMRRGGIIKVKQGRHGLLVAVYPPAKSKPQ